MKICNCEYEKKIKNAGLKLTNARKELLYALKQGHHMTVKEIHALMPKANVASIYNNLFEFEQIGIVLVFKSDKGTVYELVHGDDHHDQEFYGHLIDKEGNIHDIDCNRIFDLIKEQIGPKWDIKSIKIEISE